MTRRRYRYNPETKAVEEIGADWTDAEKRAPVPTEELVYGGLGTATDGTPIDSRRKHRDYMKANGLGLVSDYTQQNAKAEQKRQDFFAGRHEHKGLREHISRAIETVKKGRR